MSKLNEIIEAYGAIEAAERHYREILREALNNNEVQQIDVATALKRTRETIRQDAMTDEQREEFRRADAARKRRRRQAAAKGATTPKN